MKYNIIISVLLILIFSCDFEYTEDKILFNENFTDIYSTKKWISNNIKYISDEDKFNKAEYWQTPLETYLDRSGDCEDRALLFAYILKEKFNIECRIDLSVYLNNNWLWGHAEVLIGEKRYFIGKGKYMFSYGSLSYEKAMEVAYTHTEGLLFFYKIIY